jgi:hypothetical protein
MNNTFKSTWTSVIALILFFLINAALVWVSLNFLIGYSLTPLASLGYVLLLFVVRIVLVANYSAFTRSY